MEIIVPSNKNHFGSEDENERYEEEIEKDNWIAINSSTRNAKWWYSAFHNVTAMVGAGVLCFPYSMTELGWGPGVTAITLSWIITLYTLWQMVEMHETIEGKRFDRYHELGQYAFGEKLGLWIVVPQQIMVIVGVDIVYMISGGSSLKKFHDLLTGENKHLKLTHFITIFASVHFALSQLPNFNSISGVSLAATIMSISALGSIAFAYSGHNVVLEIQSAMPSTPQSPSKKPMWKGVIAAYVIVAFCYFPVAFIGYWIFGNSVDEIILVTLNKPTWLIAMANLFVVIHLVGSYQIYAMPVYDMMEVVLVKKLKFKPSWYLRFLARNTYVAFTMLVALSFPFFDGLLGFFGGFAFAPTTYFLPCIIWLVTQKPRRYGLSWFTNWVCIVLGVALMIVAAMGGLRKVIIDAKGYKFYS
ncbi:lysine histidine transporter 1-like isoform X2 [Andrographis paniculata]|uniref:lysine histidine transporter 1-like isoform X2 n=1 Tax=Andrographis paniculata TaxID=175694 RepID=UPI0021E7E4CD|nr:lysine histidine transporter 1-like isoform X2 [Andrographis paniculata]